MLNTRSVPDAFFTCSVVYAAAAMLKNSKCHPMRDGIFYSQASSADCGFLDQLCYQAVDYAHADGRTAVDCREASMFGDSYRENLQLIADTLHKQNKSLWAKALSIVLLYLPQNKLS